MKHHFALFCLAACTGAAQAAPVSYVIDPSHTFPSFEADHMGGVSVWRGKFNKSSGKVVMDRAASSGEVEIVIDMDSIDYGFDLMNTKAKSAELFDTARFPQSVYKGKLEGFVNGGPTKVSGVLSMHGVTRPLTLQINSFKCIPHPMLKRELCGADALATLNRADYGIDAGKPWGFSMDVTLRIQVEAVAAE
ncbi:MAG: polyisoprenoid-binding protein [Aquabacterium sp.]|uniref:YceI family protein n=1 Tax=Aquabacterium sp. TaxID=1872578 RepID=UPI0025C094C2|nr:YceI family protein [Aquabacterium sp.]MBI5924292.1 polyisoprenoid-binding protein [Aquabacterium sp.]